MSDGSPGSPVKRPKPGRRGGRRPGGNARPSADGSLPDSPNGPETAGFVFAASGDLYTTLARRAARSLRLVMPDAEIDLFTDQAIDDPVFAQIHGLKDGFFRPKMEAMRCSRFDRTIMLDADVIVLHPVPELFDILDICDVAGAQGVSRNRGMGFRDGTVPRCFPVINTGTLAIRKSPALMDFLLDWEARVRAGEKLDQPTFRKMLYEQRLRLTALGYEYNFMHLRFLSSWDPSMGAPRILHVADLHKREAGNPMLPYDLDEAVGPQRANVVRWLSAADWSLGGDPSLPKPVHWASMSSRIAGRVRRLFGGSGARPQGDADPTD